MIAVNQIQVFESTLYSKCLRRKTDGKIYNIEKVIIENWTLDARLGEEKYSGWWIKLLIENDQSHCLIYWQNINCTEPFIRQRCEQSAHDYELIDR